jgi:triphosphoribosyl-dephospho-CoA synthase
VGGSVRGGKVSATFAARSVAEAARIACRLEAFVPKPGNVHPGASFADVRYDDFVRAGDLCAPILGEAGERGVGQTVLDCVRATRSVMNTNPNLGIILLLAPLAAVPSELRLAEGIRDVLARLSVHDSRLVYEAIRLAAPGGLGEAPEQDVRTAPTEPLPLIMQRAASRDAIALQYTDGFSLVLQDALPWLVEEGAFARDYQTAVIGLQLRLMSRYPDSLIARKCGPAVAAESAERAARVLAAGWPETDAGLEQLSRFDQWLRADGNRRNPGTTADLIAATLFAGLRDRLIVEPVSHAERV